MLFFDYGRCLSKIDVSKTARHLHLCITLTASQSNNWPTTTLNPSVMLARLADRSADHARMWTESVVPLKRYPYRDTDKHPDFSNKRLDGGLAARSWDINVIVRPPGSSQDRSSDSIQIPFPNITILFQNGQFSGYRSHSADVSLRG